MLGEFAQTDITVAAGKDLDLGKLDWKPVRYGKQVWDIGYPDRTGDKFFKGDGANYWLWGWRLRYALLFPNDITYTIGKSDYHKDWFFEEVPHATNLALMNPEAKDPEPALRLGEGRIPGPIPDRANGPWRDLWPGPGNDLDHQVQYGQPRRARRPCAWHWRSGRRRRSGNTVNGQTSAPLSGGDQRVTLQHR